jgi:Leucine-rich repeat (LRR) protein
LTIEIQPESFPALKYLNLRENAISKIEEIKNINGFRTLESLILSFNPIVNDNKSTYIFEILTRLTEIDNLKRINKHTITKAMRKASMEWLENEKSQALHARRQKEKEEEEKVNAGNDEN